MGGHKGQTAFLSYGVRVAFDCDRPELLSRLASLLAPGWKRTSATDTELLYSLRLSHRRPRETADRYRLRASGRTVKMRGDLEEVVDILDSHLHSAIAENAPELLFVHAGVVSFGDMALVIPGRSLSGKSTLVRELVRAGAAYYSDEYAVLDSQGRVHPYARPISLRRRNKCRLRCTPEALGGRSGVHPLRVGMVLASRYVPGSRPSPIVLTPGEAVLSLVQNTVAVRAQPQRTLRVLARTVSNADAYRIEHGDARALVKLLLSRPPFR